MRAGAAGIAAPKSVHAQGRRPTVEVDAICIVGHRSPEAPLSSRAGEITMGFHLSEPLPLASQWAFHSSAFGGRPGHARAEGTRRQEVLPGALS